MTRHLNRRQVLAGIGAASALSMVGGGVARAQAAMKIVYAETEGYHWLVPYVASGLNTWKSAGLDCETVIFSSGRLGLDALLAGKADFGIATDTPFIYAAMRGLKPRIVVPYSTSATGSQPLAVRTDKIKVPQDMKGKTVATLMGGGGHYFLTRFLGFYGMTPRDVKIINMQPADMVTALVRGDVDALAWDSQSARMAQDRGEGKVAMFDTSDSPKYFRQNCLMLANNDVVTKRPEACDRVAKALVEALEFVKKDPDKAVEFVSARTKTGLKESTEALVGFNHAIKFEDRLVEDLVLQSEWAIEAKLATKPAENLDAFYRELLYTASVAKALPGSVTLKS